jgi:Flp pilus assembly protein TadG
MAATVLKWERLKMSVNTTPALTRKGYAGRPGRFRRDESGGVTFFGLVLFVLILGLGGMAVDFMRYETARAKMQGTLDRAVLAAADLDQEQPPADVVRNYFETAGMSDFLSGDPSVQEGLNYRIVNAGAEVKLPMRFVGFPRAFLDSGEEMDRTLKVSGTSTAEERVTNVEVSLVLDVSSSMQRNNRFANLVPAAHDFIDAVLDNNGETAEGLISISTVPYSAVVNPGPALGGQFDMTDHHDESNCILVPDSMFDQTALPPDPDGTAGAGYTRLSHFDYGADTRTWAHPIDRPWCFPGTENAILPFETDRQTLKNAVSAMTNFGNTAIDLGVKWGVGLLDPAIRPAMNAVLDPATPVHGRPLDWDDPNGVLKVIVLMSDGANTTEYDLGEPYKSGLSSIWFAKDNAGQALWDVDQDQISIQTRGQGTSWRSDDWFFHLDAPYWDDEGDHPRGYPDYQSETSADAQNPQSPGRGQAYDNDVYHASWQDIFSGWVRTEIYREFFREPYQEREISYNTYVATYYALEAAVNGSKADTRLSQVCAAARDRNIVIYSVAFEAPSRGRNALRDCASSPNHYFDVDGVEISEAFSAIASDIRALKLTQ